MNFNKFKILICYDNQKFYVIVNDFIKMKIFAAIVLKGE